MITQKRGNIYKELNVVTSGEGVSGFGNEAENEFFFSTLVIVFDFKYV